MRVIAYMAQSLDGYIAGPEGELDWLEEIDNPEGSDLGFAEFMAGIDALLMGRNTFEKVLTFGFWPYDKPVYVASNSLKEIPADLEGKAFLISGTLAEMLAFLSEEKGVQNLYLDGGKLIQSALRLDLLNEMTVTTLPVMLGEGIPLFEAKGAKKKLRLDCSEVLLGQLVKTKYLLS